MDVPATIREVRRSLGVSQRGLAARLETSESAVAAWESGKRTPTLRTMAQVLAQVGRVLAIDEQPTTAGSELIGYLRLSLTSRLRLALGEPFTPYAPARGQAWRALLALGRCGVVVLQPPAATGIWIPVPASSTVTVTVHRPHAELPQLAGVDVTTTSEAGPPSLVPVTVEGPVRVWVLPPAELLVCERRQLRHVADLLAEFAARDDAGRCQPAHRDPDEWIEAARMLMTKGTEQLERPLPELGRAWRLGSAASLAQAVRTRPHLM
jgi:transcriptional regulator with XRE-family HTH domain